MGLGSSGGRRILKFFPSNGDVDEFPARGLSQTPGQAG